MFDGLMAAAGAASFPRAGMSIVASGFEVTPCSLELGVRPGGLAHQRSHEFGEFVPRAIGWVLAGWGVGREFLARVNRQGLGRQSFGRHAFTGVLEARCSLGLARMAVLRGRARAGVLGIVGRRLFGRRACRTARGYGPPSRMPYGRAPFACACFALLGMNRNRFVGDDGAVGSVDPFAVVGEAGVGADGADEAVRGGLDVLGALDDEFEGGAEFALAKNKEAEGVSVAVDEGTVGEVVMLADLIGAAPMEEVLLDPAAVRMPADDAVALVATERNGALR